MLTQGSDTMLKKKKMCEWKRGVEGK
jgi:hypothetical protein